MRKGETSRFRRENPRRFAPLQKREMGGDLPRWIAAFGIYADFVRVLTYGSFDLSAKAATRRCAPGERSSGAFHSAYISIPYLPACLVVETRERASVHA